MTTVTTRTFRSGNSVALRLPKDVAFAPGTEMIVERTGEMLKAYPKRRSMAEMLKRLDALPAPGRIQERDVIEPPERSDT